MKPSEAFNYVIDAVECSGELPEHVRAAIAKLKPIAAGLAAHDAGAGANTRSLAVCAAADRLVVLRDSLPPGDERGGVVRAVAALWEMSHEWGGDGTPVPRLVYQFGNRDTSALMLLYDWLQDQASGGDTRRLAQLNRLRTLIGELMEDVRDANPRRLRRTFAKYARRLRVLMWEDCVTTPEVITALAAAEVGSSDAAVRRYDYEHMLEDGYDDDGEIDPPEIDPPTAPAGGDPSGPEGETGDEEAAPPASTYTTYSVESVSRIEASRVERARVCLPVMCNHDLLGDPLVTELPVAGGLYDPPNVRFAHVTELPDVPSGYVRVVIDFGFRAVMWALTADNLNRLVSGAGQFRFVEWPVYSADGHGFTLLRN
jgi:hypothetical protein